MSFKDFFSSIFHNKHVDDIPNYEIVKYIRVQNMNLNPSCHRHKSLKHVLKVPMLNAQQQCEYQCRA